MRLWRDEFTGWTTDVIDGDHFSQAGSTPAAVSGYPSITVPMGFFVRPAGRAVVHRPALGRTATHRVGVLVQKQTKGTRAPKTLPTLGLTPR